MTPDRPRSAASRISPAAIGISVLVHAAIAAAATFMVGLVEPPAPHLVVPVEIAVSGSSAVAEAPTGKTEAAADDSAGEQVARPEASQETTAEPAAAEADPSQPRGPSEPEVAPIDPPEPAVEPNKIEIAKAAPAGEAVAATTATRLVRDVPPPPAKPTSSAAGDTVLKELKQVAMPAAHGSAADGAPSRAARAIDQGKGGGGEAPSSAHAMAYGNAPPVYPDLARRRAWEGRVVLRVTVDITGRPADVAVRDTSGHRVLDDAAVTAVRQWRFEPARLAGVPVIAAVDVPVSFRLTD